MNIYEKNFRLLAPCRWPPFLDFLSSVMEGGGRTSFRLKQCRGSPFIHLTTIPTITPPPLQQTLYYSSHHHPHNITTTKNTILLFSPSSSQHHHS
ncbi:hypothetical protein Pcinc_032897 [Petrolisthes cinctipes]|uniref:Uncharacterized protein n=1 Tax=Petrolisthes cinctipes TaxID=88211 RepID=A0AAE1JZW3_PETCI|nr:hypothetical protein Pcinc_032897 [Petrolisthes cinctipes]